MISVLLLHSESEAKLTRKHVHDEIERISLRLGRDFTQFVKERDDKIYFEGAEGALSPARWKYIPRYGTDGDIADSAAGFALFFLTTTGMPFAAHHIDWADFVWECFAARVGAIIEAFRGSGKSIFMRILMAYLIGLYPEKSSLIIRSAATPAQKTAEGIAKIIANHHGWGLWFPPVEPKSKPGQAGGEWSAQSGYSVVDRSVEDDIWQVIEAARTSPTLTKFGLGSKSVLGSRVTLAMLADDLHDEENSASPVQLENMITRFQEIVENSRTPESRLVIIGTPWGLEDLLQQLPRTGEYRKIRTPITIEGTYPGTPKWPEHYDAEAIDKLYNKDLSPGKIGFKRNQLLDLTADIDQLFSWRYYDGKIEDFWLVRMGIDFAHLEAGATAQGRSYFAITVTLQEPISGSWIVVDGYVGQLSMSQAERIVLDLYNKYGRKPRVEAIVVEKAGDGRLFLEQLARLPVDMPLLGEPTGGIAKEVRWEATLEPALAGERILIHDNKTHPYLDKVIKALSMYPNIQKRGDWAADILDSMVWAHYHAFLNYGDPIRRRLTKVKEPNPWLKIARM